MPFPRESLPRQKNVQLISVNSENYILADNTAMQRSLYFEKITEAGKPLVFSYSAEFETAAQYFNVESSQIKPYNTASEIYKKYTAERLPHIIFSNEIKQLTNEITSGLSNPFDKVKAIYYWINSNITWASALEYSTFECIPGYVLNTLHGDCGMQTLLFMSMARSAGIPCKWQSGWMLHPGELNLHDWCEVYYEGIGWVPLDQSFGLQKTENQQLKEFYISGIDEFRLIINDDFGCDLEPQKQYFRSEPIDFQRGELEWKGGNIYFNNWNYHVSITTLN
jgi:transglutaminase-like putative cysteine protease